MPQQSTWLRDAVLIFFALVLSGCASTWETVNIPASAAGWKVGYQEKLTHEPFEELIPETESLENWTRMVTFQNFRNLRISPKELEKQLESRMRGRCPSVHWSELGSDANSVAYEWNLVGCGENPDQHEVARIIRTDEGMHRIAYVQKVSAIEPAVRAQWIKALENAQVVKNGWPVLTLP